MSRSKTVVATVELWKKLLQDMMLVVQYLILFNKLSSASSASWVAVGSPSPYRPSRTHRRTNDSMRCLSAVVANSHHAGEAYSNLASTTALYMSFSVSTHIP